MHTSSDEKPTFTGPTLNSAIDSATVSSTKPMVSDSRLELELNSFSIWVRITPISAPSASDITISTTGSTRMDTRSNAPLFMALATPNDTANTTRPTASSSATTGSRMSVSLPLALYWRTTIRVAAGAVAVAIAPSVIAAGMDRRSPPRMKCRPISATSTNSAATRPCTMPTMVACLPVFFSDDSRNSLPMANAMKPSAT